MRAIEVVNANFYMQRRYIKRQLKKIAAGSHPDGDPSYLYTGYIFPKNVKYFESIGYNVIEVKSEMLITKNNGRPTYIITPQNSIEPSDEEMTSSELLDSYLNSDLNTDDSLKDEFADDEEAATRGPILRGMLGGIPVVEISDREDLENILRVIAPLYGFHIGPGNQPFHGVQDGPQDVVHFSDPDEENSENDDGIEDDLPDTF